MPIRFYKDEKHKGAQHMTLSYTKRYVQQLERLGIRGTRGLLISADRDGNLTACRHLTKSEKPAYLTLGRPVEKEELGKSFEALAVRLSPLYEQAQIDGQWDTLGVELNRYVNERANKQTE